MTCYVEYYEPPIKILFKRIFKSQYITMKNPRSFEVFFNFISGIICGDSNKSQFNSFSFLILSLAKNLETSENVYGGCVSCLGAT